MSMQKMHNSVKIASPPISAKHNPGGGNVILHMCKIDGCEHDLYVQGFCFSHYLKFGKDSYGYCTQEGEE